MAIRLEDLLASFRRHLRAAVKAPRTIELYSQSVRYFGRRLVDRGRPTTLGGGDPARDLGVAGRARRDVRARDGRHAVDGMHRFCRWLVAGGELEKAPTEGIGIAISPDKAVPILTDLEVRDRALGLALTDVDLDRELAYVVGKGSRPRVVPFAAKTAQAVDRYLRIRSLHAHGRSTR